MAIFDGILLGTDLDGTLLRADKSVSQENIKAIEYFKSNGGLFTFFTGRTPTGAKPVLDVITPNCPIGSHNGATVYDPIKKEILFALELDKQKAIKIVERVDREFPDVGIELITSTTVCFAKKNACTEKHKKDELLPDVVCNYKNFEEPIVKLLFGVKDDIMMDFATTIKAYPEANSFDFVRSDKEYFETLPKGTHKGVSLSKIIEITGVNPNKVIAVGDNDNDCEVLKSASLGIAVANASEKAKKAADMITVSNTEHAIAKIIYDIESGKIKI